MHIGKIELDLITHSVMSMCIWCVICHVVKCVGVEKVLKLFISSYSKVGGVASCGKLLFVWFLHFLFTLFL